MSKDAKHDGTKHAKHGHGDTKHGHDDTVVRTAFGIDIGGSGIKGAPVDLRTGEFAADRVRIPTPQPATPQAVARTVAEVVDSFDLDHDVPIGVTFPAVILHGVAQSAANVDDSWIGTDVAATIGEATGRRVVAVNDADAAGYAEVVYGAARDVPGVVLVASSGRASAPRSSSTGCWCPTRSSATSRSTVTTRSRAPRTPRGTARACRSSSGRSVCSGTSRSWRTCSGPT